MTNDLTLFKTGPFGAVGTQKMQVAASATLIYPGEPVGATPGTTAVFPLATDKPVAGTDYMVGVAMSTSTNTASAAGTVEVMPLLPGQVWLGNPKVAATWNTQTEYDALVSKRVLLDLTSTAYTVLAADSANNGCVVQPLDVANFPNKVAFSFRNAVSYVA